MWPRWVADALSGKVSLARAFWLYGLGISVVYSLVGLLIDLQNVPIVVLYLVVGLALGVLQTIILWQCAPNSRSAFLSRLTRVAVVVGLILIPLMLYLLFANPDALLPPNNGWRGP